MTASISPRQTTRTPPTTTRRSGTPWIGSHPAFASVRFRLTKRSSPTAVDVRGGGASWRLTIKPGL